MGTTKLLLLAIISLSNSVKCAQILGVFVFPARSHYILGSSLMRGLAEAGHDVTMISAYEEKISPSRGSYKSIVLEGFVDRYTEILKESKLTEFDDQSSIWTMFSVFNHLFDMTEATFNDSNVKKLLNSKKKFDVVIVEQFLNDGLKIFAYHFDAPLIIFSPIGANGWINGIMGNPSPLSYIPNIITDYPPNMTFIQRLNNLFSYLTGEILTHTLILPKFNVILKKQFSNPPDIYDFYYNASLVLLTSHESLNQPVPLVPNMIPIGGHHVQPPKKLPKDLQEYLDSAKEGVVYFSMGSNLKSRNFPPKKRDAFLTAFSKLKQKVLWKWEDDELPGKPSNVKLGKWFPQQDILAHPNVKLFITHGGLLSSIETIYHGVPILAIPVFADQFNNAKTAVRNGYALNLPYNDPSFSEEKLSGFLHELLNNPKYMENVKKRSRIFHDRPLKPMENAVYWVEYVINHKGAPALRVAGINLPWYKYFLLDVITFVVVCIILILSLLYIGLKIIVSKLCRKKYSKKKNQ